MTKTKLAKLLEQRPRVKALAPERVMARNRRAYNLGHPRRSKKCVNLKKIRRAMRIVGNPKAWSLCRSEKR